MPFKSKKKRRDYMKEYMRELRKQERELIRRARLELGMSTRIRKPTKRKKPKRKGRKK